MNFSRTMVRQSNSANRSRFRQRVQRRYAIRSTVIASGSLAMIAACRLQDNVNGALAGPASVVWQAPVSALGPPALDDSTVFFALRTNSLAAINRATGATRFIARTEQMADPDLPLTVQDTPVRAADVVVYGDWYLYAFDARTGVPRWRFSGGSGVGVYPFRTDGTRIFSGSTQGTAFAIDAATGGQLWRADLLPGTNHQVRILALDSTRVFLVVRYNAPRYIGRVYALDAATGAVVWSYQPEDDGLTINSPQDMILDQSDPRRPLLLVAFEPGNIVALDAVTGLPHWTIPRLTLDYLDDRRMTVVQGVLVASSSTPPDKLVGYDVETGVERWRVFTDQGSVGMGQGRMSHDASLAYAVFTSGAIGAYDPLSGRRVWLRRPPMGFFINAPVISGDTFFLGAWDAAYAIRK